MGTQKIRAIEIGGTQTRRADINAENFEISNPSTVKTKNLSAQGDILENLMKFAGEDLGTGIDRLAYAVAGPVIKQQLVKLLPNVPNWPKEIDLKEISERRFDRSSIVVNDMEAAVIGMAKIMGVNKPFWGITWSSGIGGRFWDGEKIFSDTEIGHTTLDISDEAPICGCGKKGHVEAFISGKAIEKELSRLLPEEQKMETKDENLFETLNQAYLNKENWALDLYKKKAKIMGIFLGNLFQVNPAELILFKGTIAENALKLPGIQETILTSMQKSVISPEWAAKEIKIFEDKNDSLIGAAMIAKRL